MAGDAHLPAQDLKGFTLLEILVSMTILGIILSALYGAYTSATDAMAKAQEDAYVFQTARIVLDRMAKDLESAVIALPGTTRKGLLGLTIEARDMDRRPADRISLTTLTHLPVRARSPGTDLCLVSYWVVEGLEGEGLVLYRGDEVLVDRRPLTEPKGREMARMVTGLRLTCTDDKGSEVGSWGGDEGGEGTSLPSLIRIRLTMKDRLAREHVFTTAVHPGLSGLIKGDSTGS